MVPATGQPVAQPPPVPPAKAVVAPPPQPEPPAPAPAPAPVVAAPATRDSDFLKAIDKELASFIKACHNCEEITHDVASIGMSGQGYHNPDLEDADEAEEAMVDGMRKFERRISLFLRNIRKEAKKPVPILHHATNRETFTVLLKGLRAAEHIAMIEEVNEECDIEKLVDAVQDPSPTSTSSSPDMDRSPQLPELSSPFNMSLTEAPPGWDEATSPDTPTKAGPSSATPAWMTDELDEEWIEQADDQDEEQHEHEEEPAAEPAEASFERAAPIHSTYASLNRPRVPSSLRYAFTSSTSTTTSTIMPASAAGSPPASPPSSSGGGTFVCRDDDSNSSIKVVNSPARDAPESQLQAAVRALMGPSAGLGAREVEEGEHAVPGAAKKPRTPGDRLGGLRRLFDPPSPPTPLPPSSLPAPSVPHFNFSPPLVPRTSWKSIPHFSPTDSSSAASDTGATPLARAYPVAHFDSDETPTRKPSSRTSFPLHAVSPSVPASSLNLPATPGPSHAPNSTTPGSQLRIFEFQYDTFTRDHLAALVDEIDELGSASSEPSSATRRGQDAAWETSFVEVPPVDKGKGKEVATGPEEEESSDDDGRASKRIRLSPRESARRSAASTTRRGSADRTQHSTAKRRTTAARQTTPVDVWALAAEHPSSPSPAQSLPFAHSLAQSAKRFDSPTPPTPSRIPIAVSTSSTAAAEPATAPISTRERLDTANALLDRIRTRNKAKDAPSPSLPHQLPLSPRKILRRISASDEVDAELALSRSSADHSRLAAAASASVRSALGQSSPGGASTLGVGPRPSSGAGGDLTPSSSTGRRTFARTPVSATKKGHHGRSHSTLDAFAGFHASSSGPNSTSTSSTQHARHKSLTTIGPGDVEALLATTAATPSRMVFDATEQRWVKSAKKPSAPRSGASRVSQVDEQDESQSTEDDPFRDFDSTRASIIVEPEVSGLAGLGIFNGTPPRESPKDKNHFGRLAVRQEEEQEGDWPPGDPEEPASDLEPESDHQADEDDTRGLGREESPFHLFQALQGAAEADADAHSSSETDEVAETAATVLPSDIGTPLVISITSLPPTSPLSSIPPPMPVTPQPSSTTASAIPRSALKVTATPFLTPDARTSHLARPPRSVSFSDGKTSGKIEGLATEEDRVDSPAPLGSRLKFELVESSEDGAMGPMGEAGSLEMETPLIGSPESLAPSTRTLGIDRALRELEANNTLDTSVVLSTFESAPKVRPKASSPTSNRSFRRTTGPDATFLTECSFGVSRDRLVQFITDVEPFEPDWDGLRSISLARKGVESLVRMKDFLPSLDEADLSENEISFLTGVPSTLRTLVIPYNRLSSLTSFGHLRNLERVDLSNNHIDSVSQLACLVHLRELKADNNQIADLAGLADIDGLVRLSLKGNRIESLDFAATNWTRLETLNLSRNNIKAIMNVDRLQSLSHLNLDYNCLESFEPTHSMPRLRILRLCSNPLLSLDTSFAVKLRTLFLDSCLLSSLSGTAHLLKLENLSLRDQTSSTVALSLPTSSIRDVKRLYLSGNPIPPSFPSTTFFSLVYLELAMCGLTSLPENLAALVPNVRTLNLNFNFLDSLDQLEGLPRLRKLTVLGARLEKCRPVARVLQSMPELESVDLRMNPLTLAFYAPLVLQQGPDLPPHSDYRILHPEDDLTPAHGDGERDGGDGMPRSRQWSAIDHKFRKQLPDKYDLRRRTYREVLMETCPRLVELDGLAVGKERRRRALRGAGEE
ncbi:hypothetical protein RQP46_002673 [Phenoliferia psychrophenolica]